MNTAPAFQRAYPMIKRRLLTGFWLPGEKIDPSAIANELGISSTPVRDVLYRLLGERLVSDGPREGFIVPPMTEPQLIDLYHWSLDTLLLAIRDSEGAFISDPMTLPAGTHADRTGYLFNAIAAHAHNREKVRAVQDVNDRLHAARLAEPMVFQDLTEELLRVSAVVQLGSNGGIRSTLTRYHRRRLRAAGRIVWAMHRSRPA